jgi:hypothetical protein
MPSWNYASMAKENFNGYILISIRSRKKVSIAEITFAHV